MQFVRRDALSDYLLTPFGIRPLAAGLLAFSERPGPVLSAFAYPEAQAEAAVSGYSPVFPFRVRLVPDDPASALLYRIGRERLIGTDAQTDLYRVEEFAGAPCPARRFRVAVAVDEIGGAADEPLTVSGRLCQIGDAVEGTFDPQTRAFQANGA